MEESLTVLPEDEDLLSVAKDAAATAYAKYSAFQVGAAVRTQAGDVYSGCNVENVSYPIGTCAERNAIAAAVLKEGPAMKIMAIAVAAQKNNHWAAVIPCGACRQAIFEFGGEAKVVFTAADGKSRAESIGNLLPKSFSF